MTFARPADAMRCPGVVGLSGPEDLPQTLYDRIRPPGFFEVRVHGLAAKVGDVGLVGLCANYETGRWRAIEFADLLFDYLAEFALEYSELEQFHAGTGRRQLRKAARLMYASDKYKSRGEFGELLLHAVCREIYRSEPAISKIFLKGSVNETVHGFDAVHVAADGEDLDLLLGEVKFYAAVSSAMSAVAAELEEHLTADWLRSECMLITNRLDPAWPHSERVREMISERRTLDRVFRAIRVPVLLTYDSAAVAKHSSEDGPYPEEFRSELREIHRRFSRRDLPAHVVIDLILVPLLSKSDFVIELDRKLQIFQQI
jgi:hypothetical protein